MKVAIHNGLYWNQKWIEYAKQKKIPYVVVDCYSSDVIKVLKKNQVTHLMWHFSHNSPTDIFMARNVLFSAQLSGIKVFPDINSAWHFDDKVAQKYLLESIGAPLVPSYVFYDRSSALEWAKITNYPKVAKLRRGAGSYNVKLIKNSVEATRYIKKMFGKGLHPSPDYLADVKNKAKLAGNIFSFFNKLKKAPRFFKMVYRSKRGFPREKDYVYFQDFIPSNNYDYRVIVVNSKVYGLKRRVREGDFRASGSGMFDYSVIDEKFIRLARETAEKLKMSCVAFDFILDGETPLIVEISYGFGTEGSSRVNIHWNEKNEKIFEAVNAPYEIMDGFLK